MTDVPSEAVSAALARQYWRALLANVVSLIEDAATLLEASPARARSLLILAQEETGKAHAIYGLAERAWSSDLPTVELPVWFLKLERLHRDKIVASQAFTEDLPAFWGDFTELEPTAPSAAEINLQKQAGFYVDRDGDQVTSPQEAEVVPAALIDDVVRTAGVAEMLLITDHSRMKADSPDRYDSTHDLQARLLPFSHPDMPP